LINQFSFFGNLFYLLLTISQFFDALKVGFLFSYVAPLVFVLVVTLIKEAYDDIYRYKTDIKTNSEEFTVIENNARRKIKSSDIKVGHLIELSQNQRVPADMVVLKTFNEGNDDSSAEGNLFIRTDQLDGETDWKLRKAPSLTQKVDLVERLLDLKGFILCDPPSRMIYDFKGVLNIFDHNNNVIKEPLALENTLWASTILASKKAVGIVIYTGKETRSQMNSSTPKSKVGMLDLELNKITKILFVIMLLSAFIITCLKGFNQNIIFSLISFFRFVVLFCAIIPISLRVNLDIAKAVNSAMINRDKNIPETIARNSTIPEELGRIEYIFSDKTGTLTRNEMIFKRISLETDQFNEESFGDLSMMVQDDCEAHDAPFLDIYNLVKKGEYYPESYQSSNGSNNLLKENHSVNQVVSNKRIRRNRNKVVRDSITVMALCNNVTPIQEVSSTGEHIITYQASSPDEVALVKFAEKLKMRLIYRSDKEVKIKNANDVVEEYEILAIFPFSSDTKRMGTIVRNKKHGNIIFYMKGAENVIEKFVKEEYKGYIRENAENLASVGLRTLVLTQKILSDEFYQSWAREYNEALTSMENRKEKVASVVHKLEGNMDFLCVTGVEDLLQEDVDTTIENLRNAGIKIWMLTGDKVETATCISISAGLKSKSQRLFFIRSDKESSSSHSSYHKEALNEKIMEGLEKFRNMEKNSHVLIIDGDSLEIALSNYEEHFFKIAMDAPSVVCCRCSPTQKSRIVKTMKKYANMKRTCAIGDGGNDVAMIQEADVGIGIVGKEGLQASLAADYSITKFKHLNLLILWFGRLSYKNTATISKFVIHRGLIISLIQFIFSIIFYCSAVPIYNGMLILGYSTVYTNFPVISLLLDRDTKLKNVMKFPDLYKSLLKGRELSIKSFLWWVWKSLFQASVIMIGSILLFGESLYLKVATITFTCLIFAELLNVYSEIKNFQRLMLFSLAGTLLVYILSLILLKEILDVYYIFDIISLAKILFLTAISWLPFFTYEKFRSYLFPEAHEKLNLIQEIKV
jgi:phospholipid-translocating ATPase